MPDIDHIGKYEIRRELGRGAMGIVYEGFDPLIERVVALKTIRADQLAGDNAADVIARFRREAQAAGRLTHPNIVSIYDFGEDAGVWYIAMEFVKGRELKDYFEANERFATKDAVRILTQILSALGYAHQQGVVHRDIKPANVILLPDGNVKVADFGIAHIESSELTQAGSVLGTPSYMSPEQILGLPVDGRSDLFSVGVILYQFLTGERPFSGSATTTMRKVLEENPLPPSRFNTQIPGAMDGVARKALAKKADDRFQSADAFMAALRTAEADRSTEATVLADDDATIANLPAAGAKTTVARPAAAPPPAPAPVAEKPAAATKPAAAPVAAAGAPPAQKSQATAIAVIAGVLVLAGAGAWYTFVRSTGDAARTAQPPPTTPASVAATAPATPAVPAPSAPAPVAAAPQADPGTMVISAVGLVDPSDARYQNDKALLQSDLRADSRRELVQKALGLMLEPASLAKNYDVLAAKLLPQSASFVTTVVREGEPYAGKDGLTSLTTDAVVNVRALQKSLNQMSRDERIELIRASGDPKVSVRITARDADAPDAPPQPSQAAENILKERIKSFGFRTWTDDGARAGADPKGADFAVEGELKVKRLAMKLPASGVVVTKYALNAWTIKGIDRATGEEIYYNTTIPKGLGSWATEEEAMRAIGTTIANDFSRDLFLSHVNLSGQRVTLAVDGLPDALPDDALGRELAGLPSVIAVARRAPASPRGYDLVMAGSGPAVDLVSAGVMKPLNAKLGQACFTAGTATGEQIGVKFDAKCNDPAILSRFDTNPPAGLYGAPASRQKAVIKNPETLRKLVI